MCNLTARAIKCRMLTHNRKLYLMLTVSSAKNLQCRIRIPLYSDACHVWHFGIELNKNFYVLFKICQLCTYVCMGVCSI